MKMFAFGLGENLYFSTVFRVELINLLAGSFCFKNIENAENFNIFIQIFYTDMKSDCGFSRCFWAPVCCILHEPQCLYCYQPLPVRCDGAKPNREQC